MSIAPSGLRFTRMEHIESTSRKETRFPSKYATNLGSIHPRLLLPSTIRFSQRLSPKTFREPLFMKSIIQVWNRSYFREKNSTTIFLFSMIYKCLLGQGIENTVNTVDALYIYILRVNKISISFQYTPAVLNFVASLYDHSSIILYVSRKKSRFLERVNFEREKHSFKFLQIQFMCIIGKDEKNLKK